MIDTLEQVIAKKKIGFIRLLFTDIFGTLKSCEIPIERFQKAIDEGIGFDGSSVQGWARVHESDMILKPDIKTFRILSYSNDNEIKTAGVFCDILMPDGRCFEADPRYILKKVLDEAKSMGFEFKVGPEIEFYLFKNSDGIKTSDSGAYFDLAPLDSSSSIRKKILDVLERKVGIPVEMSHHECGPGQHEVDIKYGNALDMADSVMLSKYFIKRIGSEYGFYASFMPKPVFGIPGSGMHIHQSLWKGKTNAFYDEKDKYSLSDTAYSFLAGQLKHIKAMTALTNPTINSYKRLVSGFEAPVYICWARLNRSALIRVPVSRNSSSARIELRCPDPSCNPYLALAVMLKAGLEGIKEKLKPPKSVEENVYDFDDEKLKQFYISTLPQSIYEATQELKKDEFIQNAIGKLAASKIIEANEALWREYKTQVTDFEIKKYLPVL